MASRQHSGSSSADFNHVPMESERKPHLEAAHRSLTCTKEESWECSVYYYWWRFLKEHEGYRDCCESGGEGPHADLYRDFGDIRRNDFRSWWRNTGSHLFPEQCSSSNPSPAERGSRKYTILGKPNLLLLHRRHRLLVLVRKFPEAPLWKLLDMSEGRSRAMVGLPIERNQKSVIARRYHDEAKTILAFAARGVFPVRSSYQLQRILGGQASIGLQPCRLRTPRNDEQTDE